MVIGTWLGWNTVATIALAFVFGYALSMRGVLRAGVGFTQALKVALAADTVSIAVMEIVDNGVMVVVPGAMEAGLASPLFWGALTFAFLVAFLVTVPVNKWLIGRGLGSRSPTLPPLTEPPRRAPSGRRADRAARAGHRRTPPRPRAWRAVRRSAAPR
jgi:hypothetical protein